jgi:phosphoglycerate dehydrogenase-like enzyme
METPWSPSKAAIPTRSLRGRKIGIHGFGAIVRHLVAFLKPFGATISSYSAGVPAELFAKQGVHRCESLEQLAAGSEVFIELEALTPQTRGSVDARILGRLQDGAVFVNVGRGAVVDETALADLATSGKMTVALDVYTHEPLPLDSPLLKVPGALLSPHIAGPTQDGLPLCGDFALSNLSHYLSGHPELIEGVVTLDIYDRTT